MSKTIKVDVWSDVVCPWCYIGKRKFEGGVEKFKAEHPGVEVELTYRSYELAPDIPKDFSGSAVEYLSTHKGIPLETAERMNQQVSDIAAEVGLNYDFASAKHGNTRIAHQLAHLARQQGKQLEAIEKLFSGYFVEGRDLNDPATLAEILGELGLDPALAASLPSAELDALVSQDQQLGRELGVGGVPFYVFDSKYAVSGAQAPETFADVLKQVYQQEHAENS